MGELLDAKPKLEAYRGFFRARRRLALHRPAGKTRGFGGKWVSGLPARGPSFRRALDDLFGLLHEGQSLVRRPLLASEHSSSAQGNEPVKLPVEKRLYILVSGGGAAQRTTITDANGNIVARGTTAGEGQTSNVYGGPVKWESGPND